MREEGIDADRRGRRPRPLHRHDGRDRRVPAPTRSSSRPTRRRPRAGCGATSSSASQDDAACRSSTWSSTSTRRACPSTSRSWSPTARARVAPLARGAQGATPTRSAAPFIVVVPQEGGHGVAARRRAARLDQVARPRARRRPDRRRHDRRPRPLHRDHERAAVLPTSTTSSSPRCPATRSGWMRADLIERVRQASDKPVEHVDSSPRRRRPGPREPSHGSRLRSPPPRTTTITTARRRRTAPRASTPSCSGCCSSSSREVMVFGAFFTAYFFIRVVAGDAVVPVRGPRAARRGRRRRTPRSCSRPRSRCTGRRPPSRTATASA